MIRSVQHLTFSSAGGAGKVAVRLSNALGKLGWDSRVTSAIDSDLRAQPLRFPLHTLSAAVDDRVIRAPNFSSLVSLSRDSRDAKLFLRPTTGVFHMHWVNGAARHNRFAFPKDARVVWTLHDMNTFTGACHQSFECRAFQKTCSQCPAVRHAFQPAVEKNLENKKQALANWPALVIVSPSNWLAKLAGDSSLLDGREIAVISNPLDPRFFDPRPVKWALRAGTLEVVFVVVAANLDDPIKDVDLAVSSFNEARRTHEQIRLLLVGQGGKRFRGLPGVERLGQLSTEELIPVLDSTDYLVVPSKAENSPSVAYEAACRGVIPVVRNAGGLPEVIKNLSEGEIFTHGRELTALMESLATKPTISSSRQKMLISKVGAASHPDTVAKRYAEIYESLR